MIVRLVHDAADKSRAKDRTSDKARMIETLKGLLLQTCRHRNEGAPYATLTYSQGYADGYMRMLMDGGYLSNQELLDIIRDVRRGVDGPATRSLSVEEPSSASIVSA